MNRIRLLPEQVANQIAAGEVVERPVSVVKELVENALDAQAGRISIEIQAGGRSLIRVTDDGLGMSRDDALLSLERHATSKIQTAADLHAITSLGFRGEALPSLASVSRFTLTTRERDSSALAATQVVVHGGRIIEVKEAGAPPGTSVEARQLFYNLPARRKFLRSEETERAHIQHYLTLAALAYPQVAFAFTQDQHLVWQLPALKLDPVQGPPLHAVRERLRALYGFERDLLPMNSRARLDPAADSEPNEAAAHLQVWGFIAAPGISRSTRENQHLFVNRRPVENRGLNFALLEGYHTALMKGRYPVACVFVEIAPAEVDANIHPAKREVRFRREKAVRQAVAEAVRQTLLAYHASPTIGTSIPGASTAIPAPRTPQPAPATIHTPLASPVELPLAPTGTWPKPPGPAQLPTSRPPELVATGLKAVSSPAPAPAPPATGQLPPPAPPPSPAAPTNARPAQPPTPVVSAEVVPLLAVPLRLVGVIGKLYVVLESDRGLVLLDQHAAHERILFEQMLDRLAQGQAPSQRLLLPETIELAPRDAQFLRSQLPTLTRLGVGLSEFGERTFLLDALPPFVKLSDSRRFILDLVDELKATGKTVHSWRLGEDTVAKTVCRHAVKANDPLAGPELEKLVENLRHCAMPYTCPHGRPTLIEMNFRELEKRFGRLG